MHDDNADEDANAKENVTFMTNGKSFGCNVEY